MTDNRFDQHERRITKLEIQQNDLKKDMDEIHSSQRRVEEMVHKLSVQIEVSKKLDEQSYRRRTLIVGLLAAFFGFLGSNYLPHVLVQAFHALGWSS